MWGFLLARRRTRHRHDGQADGQRAADRGGSRPRRSAGRLRRGAYFNTFGGNPVTVAAAAVLDVIGTKLMANAAAVGVSCGPKLSAIAGTIPAR